MASSDVLNVTKKLKSQNQENIIPTLVNLWLKNEEREGT